MAGVSKRFHHKSRNGCPQCKRRRVKCDSRAPACSNCRRRDEICGYQPQDDLVPQAQYNHASGGSMTAHSSERGPWSMPSQRRSEGDNGVVVRTPSLGPVSVGTAIIAQPHLPLFEDDISARLMAHYMVRTSLEFPLVVNSGTVWRRETLHASTSLPFLRHSFMAISALHLCHTDSVNPRSYYHAACHHAIKASSLFRSTVTDLNLQNWVPVAAFIMSTTLFHFDVSFLSPKFDGPSHTITPASILKILRGPRNLRSATTPLVFPRSIAEEAEVLHRKLRECRFPQEEETMAAIDRLETALGEEKTTSCGLVCGLICGTAVRSLKTWAEFVSCRPQLWAHFFTWPAKVSDEYVSMLENGCASANVVFVYWCAIMKRAPSRYFLDGTMETLAYLAARDLDCRWDNLLQWPRKELQVGHELAYK
ncbi:hypothetical protein GQ53DRAFT_94310 [Thozetella sp. PMI_491]|nr:hypothetical protein GQ53DRAFT_94310 [Thozetella sp. PMI_491]